MRHRVAFYAPLKPPTHPNPSGDRRFARLLMQALRRSGYDPLLASTLRSRNRDGSNSRQDWIENRARLEIDRVLTRFKTAPPVCWITYHLYYKAPDLIGPSIATYLDIPYVAIEASRTPSKASSPWSRGHQKTDLALRRANLILQPNPKDFPEVERFLTPDVPQIALPPFLDQRREGAGGADRAEMRKHWAAQLNLRYDCPWMIATGMMRSDQKKQSFSLLAEAIHSLPDDPAFQLVLVGDGAARSDIEAAFSGDDRVRFAGTLTPAPLRSLTTACDLFVWPAIGEAFGMAPLEAQALGLPVVLGDRPGTRAMIRDGETGLLTPEGDASAFTAAIKTLLQDRERLGRMGQAAKTHVARHHDISVAARVFRECLPPLLQERGL